MSSSFSIIERILYLNLPPRTYNRSKMYSLRRYFICCFFLIFSFWELKAQSIDSMSFEQAYQAANALMGQQQVAEALPYTQQAIKASADISPNVDEYYKYISAHHQLAIIYRHTYQYKQADSLYVDLLEYYKVTFGETHQTYLRTLSEMEQMYYSMGAYRKLIDIIQALVNYYEQSGLYPLYLGEAYTKLGEAYMQLGETGPAQKLYYKAGAIFNEGHTYTYQNVRLLNSFAIYCKDIGQLDAAGKYIEGALHAAVKTFGKDHYNYISTVINAANIHKNRVNYAKADSLLKIAKAFYEKQEFQPRDPFYENYFRAKMTVNLSILNTYGEHRNLYFLKEEEFPAHLNKDGEMLLLSKKVLHAYQEHYGTHHVAYANALISLANLYGILQRYEDATHLYDQALEIRADFIGKRSRLHTNLLIVSAFFHEQLNEITSARERLEEYYENYTINLKQNLAFQPEAYRLSFARDKAYQADMIHSFVSRHVADYPDLACLSLNMSLSNKGLALESAVNLEKSIQENQDSTVQTLYHSWKQQQTNLAKAYLMSTAEREKYTINIWELEKAASHAERLLIEESQGNLKDILLKDQVDSKALKKQLKAGEAIVNFELGRYYNEERRWSDDKYYYVTILTADLEQPVFLKLCTASALQEILKKEVQPSGENYIADDVLAEELYYLIWNKLEPYFENIQQLHISSTALLNKVAIGAILTDFMSNQRVIDQYVLHYYSNLRDFYYKRRLSSKRSVDGSSKIVIVGGIDFEEGREVTSDSSHRNSADRSGQAFGYLQGTATEMDSISLYFAENCDWQIEELSGAAAQEAKIKALSANNAPRILHIATHGFFLPADYNNKDSSYQAQLARQRPLMRSGLALAGANNAWLDNKKQKDGEDGVLTAFEVVGLDLSGVELVVLSACETGRGEIDNTEGVLGLQRAFKLAGAQQLIISLWKVPDEQTAELMRSFYQYYLQEKDVTEAFYKAQRFLRHKYRNPYYWAAFILIE